MKNRGGRPRIRRMRTGEKVAMSLQVPVSLRANIVAASKGSGRSLTQEMEARLERSFRDDEVLAELRALRALVDRLVANSGGGGGR